ncbi:MAG: L-seryl-tRNA(Sec) selenium transferase [Nitrospirota bacterium]|jgi:L-seryl-tRNA(Ser) seleniumtransferase
MKERLRELPSVDEVLKSPEGEDWLARHPRRYVLEAVRAAIESRRKAIAGGTEAEVSVASMAPEIELALEGLSRLSLRPVINATGIVIHTNLGRSALPESALENMVRVARGYSTLEYDVEKGRRGKRYSHIQRRLREITGAEDGIVVNNNASAVLLCLSALAGGREVIVSRGELVEIGGSFRVPEVMAQSGAILREVGATNKTHLRDYESALGDETALIMKVHQSNYRITGFAQDVPIEDLVGLGRQRGVPVMYDLGSGSIVDLARHGIPGEPPVRKVVESGADLVTFSGDKLLGGPQAGIIAGKKSAVQKLTGHPLLRAIRIDKLTLAAMEAVFAEYADEDRALESIPTLRMLLEEPASVKKRAAKLASLLRKAAGAEIAVVEDRAFAGGGSLPEFSLTTYCVSVRSGTLSPNQIEARLRAGEPPVIARIREDALLLDVRTVDELELTLLASLVARALEGQAP